MKKISAIILLSCLLCALVGYRLVFEVRLYHLKTEMRLNLKNGLHRENLLSFTFTNTELNSLEWEEESEFRYKGEMFDVVRMTARDGQTQILCIPDFKEEKLLSAYHHSQKNSSSIFHL